jgi:hypothetical protein
MRHAAVLVAVALLAGAGAARASECGEQIRLFDDRYSLALTGPAEGRADRHADVGADQTTSSGASGATHASTAGIDSVPNTGGLANPRNTPVQPLDAAERERVRQALLAAKRADEANDGTTCAAKVAEARRIANGAAK